jgi:hypothetical protein
MIAAWIFAGFWNLISLPTAFVGVRPMLRDQSPAVFIILIFPIVGLGLLVWAVRATLRYRRYGVSRLELATVPAPIGRSLRGTVHASGRLDPREGLRVSLTCVRRVTTGAGRSRSTSERVLWQEERHVPGRQTRTAEGMVTAVPIDFALPADGEPTDGSNPRDQVIWRLALSAEVPGVDYHSTFEVPVFRTAESAAAATADEPPVEAVPLAPYERPAASPIRVTRNQRGTEIEFPAGRNPGASAGLTAFLLIWLGATWATWHFGAPALFQLIFGAVGLLILWATLASWLGVSRVTADRGSVSVARGLLVPMREQRLDAAEIAEVTTKIGMQAGTTPYYDLTVVRNDGRRIPLGRSIRDKREADWLAATVREALRG